MKNRQRIRVMAAIALASALTVSSAGSLVLASDTTSQQTASASDSTASSGGNETQSGPPSAPGGEGSQSGAPQPPDGQAPGGQAPGSQAPDGSSGAENAGGAPGGIPGGGGGADTQSYDYSGTLSGTLTADGEAKTSDGETIASTDADVNAALAENGGDLTITNGTLTKSGDDTNGDNCNFYGVNSILLAVGEESKATVSSSTLTADSEGSNAVFATDKATVYASGDTIHTTAGNSRGLDATYGGTIVADQMDITTEGDHSATVATDRGGGNISLTNSSLSTSGSGSPLLYSTGDIEVDNVTGTSTGSQIAGMEGLNTILISNSSLTSEMTDATASDPIADGIIIYQSTSGDAETTTGEAALFQATNSTLTSKITSGAMFYLTNTKANVVLSETTLDFDSDNVNLLTVEGNDSNNWGTAGSNGATVSFTGLGETLSGNITVDTISSLDLYLLDGTTYTGAMSIEENAVNTDETDAPITVNLSSDSTWVVTADSTISALNAEDGAKMVDADGNTVTIVANGETVVQGASGITVSVNGQYSTAVTTSDANEVQDANIDRSDFDSSFSTSTTYGTNSESVSTASGTEETEVSGTVPDDAASETGSGTEESKTGSDTGKTET